MNENKIKLHIVFGSEPARELNDDEVENAIESIKQGNGEYHVREFNTEDEKRAYIQGINDVFGWENYSIIEETLLPEDAEEAVSKFNENFNRNGK